MRRFFLTLRRDCTLPVSVGLFVILLVSSLRVDAQELTKTTDGWEYEQVYQRDRGDATVLILEDLAGDIEVSEYAGSRLEITQGIPFGDMDRDEAMKRGQEFELEISASGSQLSVEGNGMLRGSWLAIRVPSGMNVELETDWGSIEVSDLSGNLAIQQGGGSIEVQEIQGSLTIRSDGGTISVEDIGGRVIINSDGGGVEVARIRSSLTVISGGGGIEAEQIRGDVSVTTAGGNIDVFDVQGSLRAVTSAGNMAVMTVTGDVDLSSGGGSIEVADIEGSLTATTSGGDIEAGNVQGAIRVETLAGDIELSGVRSTVRIISEVGDVELDVVDARFLQQGRIEIDLGHGDIELNLPKNTDAMLIANVQEYGGIDISNEGWDVDVVRTRGQTSDNLSRRAEIRIGDGGGEIQIRLLNGEITVDND